MLLAVDIGGTKCELALFPSGSSLTPVARKRFASADYPDLEEIVAEFLSETGEKPTHACVGVAGVVSDGCGRVTNLPWIVREETVQQRFGFQAVQLINDLTSVCASLPILEGADLMEIQAGQPQAGQLIGVVAPGTGLGEGLLVQKDGLFFPRGCEGGHADFAPVDELQTELMKWMLGRRQRVSYESLIAGPGIPNLYDFLHEQQGIPELAEVRQEFDSTTDRTPVIFHHAFSEHPCLLCRQTIDLFLEILGAEAGNLALKLYARGGIYIGGGIVPRIADKVSFDGFRQAFQAKGKMAELMEKFPVQLILRKDAALLGVAKYGREIMIGTPVRTTRHFH
ncbi:glucokinase [Desulfosediminicola sp.]|uniref:glucokinase n=1 Tax=Desulfosediminicola sp. TaxID=2886825 RepID=UPI003AF2AC90